MKKYNYGHTYVFIFSNIIHSHINEHHIAIIQYITSIKMIYTHKKEIMIYILFYLIHQCIFASFNMGEEEFKNTIIIFA